MQDWNAYRDALLGRVGDFAKLSPDVLRGLNMIDGAGIKTGRLEPKMHELIALAVAVTTRCDGCIAVHAKKAIELGASEGEIGRGPRCGDRAQRGCGPDLYRSRLRRDRSTAR